MIYFNVEQGTEEWMALRRGKATTSNFGKIAANEGKAFGNPAKEYALKIALESIGCPIDDNYTNEWMERGTELEPVARSVYQDFIFNEVGNGGFCIHGDYEDVGGSPDGLVDKDGGIEIKCPKYTTHYATLKRGSFDPSYKWQLIGNLWLCKLEWIDFVSYCPDFPESKQLFVHRLERPDFLKELAYLDERVPEFISLVESIREDLK
jgi:hypothetical protein